MTPVSDTGRYDTHHTQVYLNNVASALIALSTVQAIKLLCLTLLLLLNVINDHLPGRHDHMTLGYVPVWYVFAHLRYEYELSKQKTSCPSLCGGHSDRVCSPRCLRTPPDSPMFLRCIAPGIAVTYRHVPPDVGLFCRALTCLRALDSPRMCSAGMSLFA